jgi:6-phosphogluconolactonase
MTDRAPDRAAGLELVLAPDAEAAQALAAVHIVDALRRAIRDRGVAHWVTTGGSTSPGIYQELLHEVRRDLVDWERVHIWWTDDRYVPRDDQLSNVPALTEILLGASGRSGLSGSGEQGIAFGGDMPGVYVPVEQVHQIPTTEAIGRAGGPEWAAARYEEALRAADIELSPSGFPVFDAILVGIGGDGHLFSVFPGSAVWDDPAWVQGVPAPTHIEPHVPRVTMHPEVLRATRRPIVVAFGESKADAVGRAFAADGDERETPARVPVRPGAIWILDEAAAASIPR